MNRLAVLVIGLILAAGLLPIGAAVPVASTPALPSTPAPTGTLVANVAVVTADLSVKPVPKWRFLVVAGAGARAGADTGGTGGAPAGAGPVPVVTGFDGGIRQALPEGSYRIRSEAPLDLEGRRLSWDVPFAITAGATTSLELSNDNAAIEGAAAASGGAAAGPRALDAGALYERYRLGVVKIVADRGHGSGFLVGADGLLITNHHVVADASAIAARLDDAHKHQVVVVAEDAHHDIAVLRIHPDTIRERPVLVLAEDAPGTAPLAVGDRVVAIGSPLTTETILTEGVVSKVSDDRIISDVNINPGNSGGPLLDAAGRVVGINTYSIGDGQGPGLSGITRIHLARPILEKARVALEGAPPPDARALPVESAYRFDPGATRQEVFARDRPADDYQVTAGKLNLTFITPMLIAADTFRSERAAEEGRQKRKKGKEENAPEGPKPPSQRQYAWQGDEDNFRPVVRVRALPALKMTFGSAFKMSMIGRGGKFRFKTDFDRMELRRGDQVVEPIHVGRIKEVINVQGPAASLNDIIYWGLYEYAPEAFEPGAPLVLRVWEQELPEPHVIEISETLLSRIREDFAPYLATSRGGGD